jgi:hypothetical protein
MILIDMLMNTHGMLQLFNSLFPLSLLHIGSGNFLKKPTIIRI